MGHCLWHAESAAVPTPGGGKINESDVENPDFS